MISPGNYVNRAVQKFSVPSWMTLNLYMKCVDPITDPAFETNILEPESVMDYPLPMNVKDRSDLNPNVATNYPHSFYDVPALRVNSAYQLRLKNVSLLYCRDKWKSDFFAIVTAEGRSLIPPGIGYRTEHRHAYRTPPRNVESGTWCLGMWFNNYYMWHIAYMTNLLRAKAESKADQLVLPEPSTLKTHVRESLGLVGLAAKYEIGPSCPHLHFDELSIIQDSPYRGEQVRKFREEILQHQHSTPNRKVFVSRRKASFRKILNEDAVAAEFVKRGWEIRCMEDLSYHDQIQLMSETKALAGMQGAGFGNMLFMPAGGQIIEFNMVPSANFYALACCLGHHYWLSETPRAGNKERLLYDDTVIDIDELVPMLDSLEEQFVSHSS